MIYKILSKIKLFLIKIMMKMMINLQTFNLIKSKIKANILIFKIKKIIFIKNKNFKI